MQHFWAYTERFNCLDKWIVQKRICVVCELGQSLVYNSLENDSISKFDWPKTGKCPGKDGNHNVHTGRWIGGKATQQQSVPRAGIHVCPNCPSY